MWTKVADCVLNFLIRCSTLLHLAYVRQCQLFFLGYQSKWVFGSNQDKDHEGAHCLLECTSSSVPLCLSHFKAQGLSPQGLFFFPMKEDCRVLKLPIPPRQPYHFQRLPFYLDVRIPVSRPVFSSGCLLRWALCSSQKKNFLKVTTLDAGNCQLRHQSYLLRNLENTIPPLKIEDYRWSALCN